MNMPQKVLLTLWILMVILTCTPLHAATPEESFRKSFPDIQMDSMKQTDIPGVYEIVSNGRIAYYAPGPRYLILGDIVTEKKKNLTQERIAEMLALRIKTLPLKKALKIGNGPHTVIEITDPDCDFCRKASEYFAKRKDVTRYIFLYPVPTHPNAEEKIRYIFCAKDRAKAYEEVMTGKLDNMKFKPCDSAEAAELVKTHTELCVKVGSKGFGTPMFLIEGQAVMGFDMPQIDKILGAKK